jgi:hypothetical protein
MMSFRLARAELHLALATVFRRYEHQELFESSRLDVDVKYDFFLGRVDKRSKGVRNLFEWTIRTERQTLG